MLIHVDACLYIYSTLLQRNCTGVRCQKDYVNAEDNEGVILNCIDEMSCYQSHLICPSLENATCIVGCYSEMSCGSMIITTYDTNALYIDCVSYHACKDIQVYIEEGYTATISCSYNESCTNGIFEIRGVGTFELNCEGIGESCSNVSVVALDTRTNETTSNSSEIIVDCDEDRVCSGMHILLIQSEYYPLLTVNCGQESLVYTYIYCFYAV